MSGILNGIRVLDFGRFIAGPYCAAILADFGAEVIRIEKIDGSEDRFVPPVAEDGSGALFMQVCRNKKGLTLNPMKPAGREIVRKLVATADVVVANLPDQTLNAMGLDYETLKEIKPDIILTTPSAFGTVGPYSHKLGFDGIGQAMSGAMYLSGTPDQPYRAGAAYIDYGTALFSALGTVMALYERDRSGQGQRVETSLLATGITFTNATLIEQAIRRVNRVATGNRGQTAAPSDVHRTKDGWVLVQTLGQPLFERWVKMLGEEHWLDDSRFADDLARGDHGEIISARMASWCAERTSEQALTELETAGIPAGPVLSPQQVLDDPHVQAANYFRHVDYPGMPQPAPVTRTPIGLSRTPGDVNHRAPLLGEHTDEILASLGYGAEEVAGLRAQRVV